MLEADYIFLHVLLESADPKIVDACSAALTEMLRYQNEDGSWSIIRGPGQYQPGGEVLLRLQADGDVRRRAADGEGTCLDPDPRRSRKVQYVQRRSIFARWVSTTSMPCRPSAGDCARAEVFYFNIYEISSWSRAILVPLSIAYAKKPFKKIPVERGIDELFVGGRDKGKPEAALEIATNCELAEFLSCSRPHGALAERVHIRPLRAMAFA